MEQRWVEKMLDEKHHATAFNRSCAFFYDMVVLVVVLVMTSVVTTWWMGHQSNAPHSLEGVQLREYILEHEFHLFVINWIVLATVGILFQFIFPMMKRKTIGMRMVGLYLKDEHAKDISKGTYLKRECLKLVLFPTMFIKGKRPLYDRLTKTYLLK
ncbi:hypothetical protein BKP35_11825 [Anaerobacillus arseniciselenatis]|uniref:RDD domain-containing protein n=1 Tax=Anaerobacillus arseniciselenatis TaxID=85682 RepID=A0A1S2LGW1_9BACI|nr:RDD family protein [Anaerobacillus arseniciselenatis]OIJ11621.1 hypothetical protein BKP35_11825 [Anaerobacillus arseniciselenatis]